MAPTSMSTLPFVPSGIISLTYLEQSGDKIEFTMSLITDCLGSFSLHTSPTEGQVLNVKGHGVKWMIFDLQDPNYVMIGIAFKQVISADNDASKVGLATFPYATVERYADEKGYAGSMLTVCDYVHHHQSMFGFLIVVQNLNGDLLEFDPGIENEPF